jgi:electron transport complex protein RnfB
MGIASLNLSYVVVDKEIEMFIAAVVSLTILGTVFGLLLGVAARHLKVEGNPLAAEIEQLLPGSQCGQCGFPGCTGAAQALAEGSAPVTLCPPGGRAVVQALAAKLGIEADLSGVEEKGPMIAEIKEEICIGCTRCFKVCPTDAIMGAAQQIHVVFREACTACGKCEEVCPTESVKLQPVPVTLQSWYWNKPQTGSAA